MKTKILSILLFGALAAILSACSTDLAPEPDALSGKRDSCLRLEIQKQDLTRAGLNSTSFEKGDSVFVIVRDTEHPDPLTFISLAYYDGEDWILEEKIDLSAETYGVAWTSANVEVYYPYWTFYQAYDPKNPNQVFIIKNPLDQEDILYGKATGINAENSSAKVSCDHLKTRLTFQFNNNSDSTIGISKISVTTEGEQLFLGRYGYISGGYFHIPDEYTKDYSMSCNIEIPAGEAANLDFLIPPTEQAYEIMEERIVEEGISQTLLKGSIELSTRTVNFDITLQPWAPGRRYIYPITISNTKPNPESYGYVDLGLSVLWASCNVGASSPYDKGELFFWGYTEGYRYGETYSEIDLSLVQDKTPEQLLEGNIIELDLDDSDNPYRLTPKHDAATKKMGSPWRMPTNKEIRELIDNTTLEWFQREDKWMFKFTSTVQGFEDKFIIIPESEFTILESGMLVKLSNPFVVEILGSSINKTYTQYTERITIGSLFITWVNKYDNAEKQIGYMGATYGGKNVRAVRPRNIK